MSESISDDSDFIKVKNSSKNSIFSNSIKKFIIVIKKQRKYFFTRFHHYTKAQKIKECLILFLAFISYVLYYLSLGGCDRTQTECLKNSNIAYYYMLVNHCFISALLHAFIFYLMLDNIITKLHLIHQIVILSILFMSDTGSTLMHHGIYNIIGFFLFLIILCFFFFVLSVVRDILTKKSMPVKLIVINIIIIVIILGRYSYHESLKKECKDWDMGLNDTRIEDDINKYPCQIFRPISCHINYFNKKQDLSRLMKLDCSNGANSNQAINSRKQLIKYINKKEFENTKRFGFPLTNREKFIINPYTTPDSFTRKVYDNIIDMDNKSITINPNEYPEVILNFEETGVEYKKGDNSTRYMGKININITRNEILSASRKKLENPDSLFNNILMIYTDAVSRAHFKRQMPKTCAFIEKLMKNNFENDYVKYNNEFIKFRKEMNKRNLFKGTNITNNNINKSQNIEKEKQKINISNNLTQRILDKNKTSNTKKSILNTTSNLNIRQNSNYSNNTKTKIKGSYFSTKKINLNSTNFLNRNKTIKNESKKDIKNIVLNNTKMITNKNNYNKSVQIIKKTERNLISKKNIHLSKKSRRELLLEKIRLKKLEKLKTIQKQKLIQQNINKKMKKTKSKKLPRKLEIINNTMIFPNISNINLTNFFENKYYAYQFLKYHTFTSGTKFNAMPMFYGKSVFSSSGINIINYFKQLGFITAQSTDMCSKEVWEPEKEPPNLDFDLWDHENVAMFCDPSYMDRNSLYSIYKGVYSFLRRCFYGKEVHDYIFEYGKKFWEAYPDNKKFLRLGFNDGHESTFEVLKYLDEPMVEFLEYFLKKGYLKNTAIIIISDHGNHMPGLYNLFLSEQFETERVLGNFFLIFNTNNLLGNKLEMFRLLNKNVMENQQSIITPYDVHDTMMNIIYGNANNNKYSNKGKSVFSQIDNSVRDCSYFDQDDEEKGLCRCIPNNKYEKFVYYNDKK